MTEHLSPLDIERLADGDLDFDPHLGECLRCSNEVLAIVQLKRAIAALPRHVGRASARPASARRDGLKPVVRTLAIAASIAVVAVLSTMYVRGRDEIGRAHV